MLMIIGSYLIMIFCAFVFGARCVIKFYNHLVYHTTFFQDVIHIAKIGLIGIGVLFVLTIIIGIIWCFRS